MGFLDDITGGIYDILGGGGVHRANLSGAFPNDRVQELGGLTADLLTERAGPITEQPRFQQNVAYIRDLLGRELDTSMDRLGQSALNRGSFDSAALLSEGQALTRDSIGNLSSAITELMNYFSEQQLSSLLPYLGAASQEFQGVEGLRVQGSATERGQNLGFVNNLFEVYGPDRTG